MEAPPNSKVFKFNPNQVKEVQELFYYDSVNKLNQDINILQDWIGKQNHFVVKEFERGYLERFLLTNKGSVERTKQRLDRLFTLRNLFPEFTKHYDLKNEFVHLFKCTRQCVLPYPSKDHYRVIMHEVYNPEAYENVELAHFYRLSIVFVEYMLRHDYNAGVECVLDNRKISLGLFAKMNPLVIHKFFILMEAYGIRVKALHIISNSKFLDAFVAITKQGMSEKLGQRIQVHTSLESLHRFIPRETLPLEYGGDAGRFDDLRGPNLNPIPIRPVVEDSFLKELLSEEHSSWMKFIEGATTDEGRRLTSTFSEEFGGLPGSFKQLCVD